MLQVGEQQEYIDIDMETTVLAGIGHALCFYSTDIRFESLSGPDLF
jgi:hypothetical protein